MIENRRFMPHWPLPDYIFVPGTNPHPKKDGGHMEGLPEPVAPPVDRSAPQNNEFLRFALDLYNHQYFWESHVYFEAIWNAHKRLGSEAEFCKGFIKLGAAGVKFGIDQKISAQGHLERAKELFQIVQRDEGDYFLGFDIKNILQKIDEALTNDLRCFEIYPGWD